MSGRRKLRARPTQLRLEDIRALNASLSELAKVSKGLPNHVAHGGSSVIMPPSGSLVMTGSPTEVPTVRRIVMIPVALHRTADLTPATRPVPEVLWLDAIAFLIPKSIREPFLGDLREDLANKAAKGHSSASIWLAAASQVAILALRLAWSIVVGR
jgi:hypothetical protein